MAGEPDADWLVQQLAAGRFNQRKLVELLGAERYNRAAFDIPTSIVDAFNDPLSNSVTLTAAIAQPPFFHVEWPAAMNWGGLGMAGG